MSDTTVWEAEGVLVTESGATGTQVPFRVSYAAASSGPARARLEVIGGPNPLVRLCDGTVQWTYLLREHRYWKAADPGIEPCAYPFTEWAELAGELESPVVTGRESLKVEGRSVKCAVVQASLPARGPRPAGKRTLWIGDAVGLVWRYRIETPGTLSPVRTYTFLWQAHRSLPREEDLWKLDPGDGATEISAAAGEVEQARPANPGAPASPVELPKRLFRIGGRVLPPRLLHKTEPSYTKSAQQERIQGTVLLEARVDTDGKARNFQILHSLDSGLDQNAIEAVSKWRFRPGTRDGQPVPVLAQFEVNFVLR